MGGDKSRPRRLKAMSGLKSTPPAWAGTVDAPVAAVLVLA